MRKRTETIINLVRPDDDDTYQVLTEGEMTFARCRYKVIPESVHVDEKTNTHVRRYIRVAR